jgi:hypothetical protein
MDARWEVNGCVIDKGEGWDGLGGVMNATLRPLSVLLIPYICTHKVVLRPHIPGTAKFGSAFFVFFVIATGYCLFESSYVVVTLLKGCC